MTRYSSLSLFLCGYFSVLPCQAYDTRLVAQAGRSTPVSSVLVNPTGRTLQKASDDTPTASTVAFSPDGKILVSCGALNTIKFWDVASGKAMRTLAGAGEMVNVGSVAFSPDGRTLASDCGSKIKLWQVATGKQLLTLVGHKSGVLSVAFSPDGKTLASGSFDNTIKLWDVASGRELRTLTGYLSVRMKLGVNKFAVALETHGVYAVAFSPDGKTLAGGGADGIIKLWDAASGRELRSLTGGHPDYIQSVAFSPDGKTLASGGFGGDENIRLWDVASGKELNLFHVQAYSTSSVTFKPDSKILFSGSYDRNGGNSTLKVWDVTSGKVLTLVQFPYAVNSVACSRDGKTLAACVEDSSIRVWELSPRANSF